MKKHLPTILAAAACVLAIACLFELSALGERMERLDNAMGNRLSRMESAVYGISGDVSRAMEREASLLSGSGWEYGEVDIGARTVLLRCTVTPKEYRAGVTAAVLTLGGAQYPMTEENGQFAAEVLLPLFENTEGARVVFSEGGVRRTEELEWSLSPRWDLLPSVYGDFSGQVSRSGGIGDWTWSGGAGLDAVFPREEGKIVSMTAVWVLDGKKIDTAPMTVERQGDCDFYGYAELEKTLSLPEGSVCELYAEAADSFGLRYRVLLDRCAAGGDREPEWQGWSMDASIYAPDGTLLYEGEY